MKRPKFLPQISAIKGVIKDLEITLDDEEINMAEMDRVTDGALDIIRLIVNGRKS